MFKPIKVKLFLQGFVDAKYAKDKIRDEVYDNCLPDEIRFPQELNLTSIQQIFSHSHSFK